MIVKPPCKFRGAMQIGWRNLQFRMYQFFDEQSARQLWELSEKLTGVENYGIYTTHNQLVQR